MRSVVALSLGMLVTASSGGCKKEVNACDENRDACKFVSVMPSVAYPNEPWPLKVTFPKELDLDGISTFPLLLTQGKPMPDVLELVPSPQGETWEVSAVRPLSSTLRFGTVCLQPQTSKEAGYFKNADVTLKGKLSFPSSPLVYTDTDTPSKENSYPWPVWAGIIPGSTTERGFVAILNDGRGQSKTSARKVKILDSSLSLMSPGVTLDAAALMHEARTFPQLDLIPVANIAHGKLIVTTPYDVAQLTLRECEIAQTDISKCKNLMGTDTSEVGKLLPLPIGFLAGDLRNKTLIAYAYNEGGSLQVRTNTFKSDTGTSEGSVLSHAQSKVAPNPPAGTFSRAFFGMGSLSRKASRELIVVLMDTSSVVVAISVYVVADDGSLTAASDKLERDKLETDLKNAIGSEAVSALTFGDLDDDTLLDVVIAKRVNSTNQISFKVNQGEGVFTDAPQPLTISSVYPITAVAVGNWDGMGTADVVATIAQDRKVFAFANSTPRLEVSDPCK